MMAWFKKKISSHGLVLQAGSIPSRLENFSPEKKGFSVSKSQEPKGDFYWSARVSHPQYGEARIDCPRKSVPVYPKELLEHDPSLTAQEKGIISAAETGIMVTVEANSENILRDRKRLLRFMDAFMNSSSSIGVDAISGHFWPHGSLQDELAHDADLDVNAIFVIHELKDDDMQWCHTHGLGEIGAFDFDVFDPHEDIFAAEVFRALAFAVLEGNVRRSTSKHPLTNRCRIAMVDVDDFRRGGDRKYAQYYDDDDAHRRNRSVVCEPSGGLLGFLSRKPQINRSLTKSLPQGSLVHFSSTATELMALRAKNTYSFLRSAAEEMAMVEPQILVKLGYKTDDAKDETTREHLWFEVHEVFDNEMDATLLNQPYNIARLKEGDRGRHPIDLLSDWAIMTPLGRITPGNATPLRILRENREEILQKIAEFKASEEADQHS